MIQMMPPVPPPNLAVVSALGAVQLSRPSADRAAGRVSQPSRSGAGAQRDPRGARSRAGEPAQYLVDVRA